MSTLILPAFSDLAVVPDMESWFDSYSQSLNPVTLSMNSTLSVAATSAAPNQLHRQSSIFPNLSAPSAALQMHHDKTSAASVDLPAHGPQLTSNISLESHSSKTSLVDEDPVSGLESFQHASLPSTLSPWSDASSPSDLEHPHSPFSPHQCKPNQACCAQSVSSTSYPQAALSHEESDSRATSPSLGSDDEVSQINQNIQEEKFDTPPFPASIAPQPHAFPTLTLSLTNAMQTTTISKAAPASDASAALKEEAAPSAPKSMKSKRSRRRNLIRALKEQTDKATVDGNGSGSEGELMNAQPCGGSTRSKRSYIALLGAEGQIDDEEDEKAASGSKRDRNKASASAYRKRRKIYLDTLEARVTSLNDRLKEKDEEMAKIASENRVLREQVSFLKRLINFKASDEDELKQASDSMAATSTAPSSSSSLSSSSSSAFGISTSRLNFGQFTTNGSSRHASVFLLLLFSCFLLFNPLWTGTDLTAGLSDSSSAGLMPVGRLGRSLLSFESTPSSAAAPAYPLKEHSAYVAPHPLFLSSAVVNEVNEAAQMQYLEQEATKKAKDLPSNTQEQPTSSPAAAWTSSSSSSSSSSAHDGAWYSLSVLAEHVNMDPSSPQFAELVASAYLPLVSILGEAATQAALRDLASGVFFIQHQALFQALAHSASTNGTTFAK